MTVISNPYDPKKILAHPERLRAILTGKIVYPVTLEVDPTDGVCNGFCPHCCFEKFGDKPVFIKIKPLFKILEKVAKRGVLAVELVGGTEPTMHKEIADIIKAIFDCGLQAGLVTNGILLKKVFPVASKLTFLRVSLDAGSRKTYYQVHGIDCFEKVVKNIELLAGNYMSPKKVGLAFLCLPQNSSQSEINSVIELGIKLKLGYVVFRPAILPKNWPSYYLKTVSQKILSAQKRYGKKINIFSSAKERWQRSKAKKRQDSGLCYACNLTGVIMADGNMPFCNLFRGKKNFYLGNIYRQSFSEIWEGKRHLELLKSVDISACPVLCKANDYRKVILDYKDDLLGVQEKGKSLKITASVHPNFI